LRKMDINVDLGEGAAFDEELLKVASSANVCCGAHAGSEELTKKTIERCVLLGVRVGAHPGYPDPETMGRHPLGMVTPMQMRNVALSLSGQIAFAMECGPVAYLKPHGAFYNESAQPSEWCGVLLELLGRFNLPLVGMPGSEHERIAATAGVGFIREGFADRAYQGSGRLMPRTQSGAILTDPDEIRRQVRWLMSSVESICIHGDEPDSVRNARLVREVLESAGCEVGV